MYIYIYKYKFTTENNKISNIESFVHDTDTDDRTSLSSKTRRTHKIWKKHTLPKEL